jgi:hypothetical protein
MTCSAASTIAARVAELSAPIRRAGSAISRPFADGYSPRRAHKTTATPSLGGSRRMSVTEAKA